jgi:hypothetical protein
MIGAVIQILGGSLVLAWGCCAALNYRGTAEYPLQAHVDWRRKHPRFDRMLGWAWPRARENGNVQGVGTTRIVMGLFLGLLGTVLLLAGLTDLH